MPPKFFKNRDGNVAVIFALVLVPVMGLLGAAIDYSRGAQAHARMRSALDAAALAAAASTDAERTSVGQSYLASNLQSSEISGVRSSFVMNADGALTAKASGSINTYVTGVIGVKSMPISASVTVGSVATPPKELTFTAIAAQGWYWKQVDLIIQNAGTTEETTLASYVYQPLSQTTIPGTLTAKYNDGLGNMVVDGLSKKLIFPANYQNLYLKMTVYPDGCGPGMVPAHNSTSKSFKCAVAGASYTKTTNANGKTVTTPAKEAQKAVNPDIYTTNPKVTTSATSAHNLFVQDMSATSVANNILTNGKLVKNATINGSTYKMAMIPNGQTPTVFDILPCPSPPNGLMQQWEDTTWNGKGSSPPPSWAAQDFTFNVKSHLCASNTNYIGVGAVTSNGTFAAARRSTYLKN